MKGLQSEVNVTKQDTVDITKESLKSIFGRMPNWKSSRPGVSVKKLFASKSKITASKHG